MSSQNHEVTAGSSETAEATVARRRLLRGGVVLAGTAGLAAATALAGPPTTAAAADGDPFTLGRSNTASDQTRLTIGAAAGSSQPALSLQNASGAALELTTLPDSWSGELQVGQIANQTTGPLVGVDHGQGTETAYVALGVDLDALSLPVAISPERVLDTRSSQGRRNIISSTNALDATGRLRAGQWLELALAPTDQTTIEAVFANLTVTQPLTSGYLSVYPGGSRPVASSINFAPGQTIANAGVFATDATGGSFVVRIYASATAHVIFDITGFIGPASPPLQSPSGDVRASDATSRAAEQRSARRRSAARRTVKALRRR